MEGSKSLSLTICKCGKEFKSLLTHIALKCKHRYTPDELQKMKDEAAKITKSKYAIKRKNQGDTPEAKKAKSIQNKAYKEKHKNEIDEYIKQYYQANKTKRAQSYRAEKKSLQNFYKEIQYGPVFPCGCCMRCLPLRSVYKLTENFKKKLIDNLMIENVCLKKCLQVNGNHYLCGTCYNNLGKGIMSSQCFNNGLKLADVPECLKVSDVGNQLLAKNLVFMKVSYLTK